MDGSAEVRGTLMCLYVHEYMYDSYMYMYDVFYNNVGILNRVRIRALDLDLNSILSFPGCDWLKSNKDDDVLSLKNENLQIKDILGIATKVSDCKPQRCALANWNRRILQGTWLPLGKGGESNSGKARRRKGHRTSHCWGTCVYEDPPPPWTPDATGSMPYLLLAGGHCHHHLAWSSQCVTKDPVGKIHRGISGQLLLSGEKAMKTSCRYFVWNTPPPSKIQEMEKWPSKRWNFWLWVT